MISRYTRKAMARIWSDEHRFETWKKVEHAMATAQASKRVVPKEVPNAIKACKINLSRIDEIEKITKHDVLAFTTSLSEQMGENGKWLHFGMTSSDVIDTALSCLIQESGQLILGELEGVLTELKKLADENKKQISVGRSHGIHGEPTSFGLKFLSFWAEMNRNKERLEKALKQLKVGQFSGAMGNFSTLDPELEKSACEILGLQSEPISTQVIPRDRHSEYFFALAILGSGIERIAVELRHLQRTEVMEVEEGFSKGQKGSSAMPHKKNPISGENLTGCARMLRSSVNASLENIVLWHERDISHSSVERVFFPDASILADYALHRLKTLLSNLKIFPEQIEDNLNQLKGLPLSGVILVDLVKSGLSREKAYELIQKHAHHAWDQNQDFLSLLEKESEITTALGRDLRKKYSSDRFLTHVDHLYSRTYGEKA